MRNNPYPDEPTRVPSAETLAQRERMEDLPPRQMPPQMSSPPVVEPSPEAEDVEVRQEEVRTIRYAIEKLNDFLQWFLVVMEVTLAIRFFFKLIGASTTNLFAGFLYALTDIVLIPFANIVRSPSIAPEQAFEWSTLIAMIIYWLIFWAIRRFLSILVTTPEESEG